MHDLQAAVVGTGFIGPVHVEALRRLGIRVRGILGSSGEKSCGAAGRLGLEKAYGSYAELLDDQDVAAVHLTSPNRFHHAQVLQALEAGKHVVCEKPLAMHSAQTGELVEAAAAHPELVTAVNYNIRFYPLCLEARAMIRHGEIGDVLHVQGSYVQDWLLEPTDFNWRVLSEDGGATRAVGDIGTHWLDLMRFVTGLDVASVMADLWTVHPVRQRPLASIETFKGGATGTAAGTEPVDIHTEDYGSVLLRFQGGRRGVMTVSQVTAGRKNCLRFEIAGSRRGLYWNSETPNALWIGDRRRANGTLIRDPSLLHASALPHADYPGGHNEGFADTFKQLYRAIYRDIEKGGKSSNPLYATFEDGHREVKLCEAILESHRRGTWIDLA